MGDRRGAVLPSFRDIFEKFGVSIGYRLVGDNGIEQLVSGLAAIVETLDLRVESYIVCGDLSTAFNAGSLVIVLSSVIAFTEEGL